MADTYYRADCRDTWKSVARLTAYSIGALLHHAKAHGYHRARVPSTPSERARLDYEASEREHTRKLRDARIKTQRDETQARAARRAQEIWEEQSAPEGGTHAYLQRKGLNGAYGTRRTISDEPALLVPMRDIAGMLCNLQFISPDGEKRFMRDGRVSGCYYALSEPADAARIIICEGFATGASLAECFSGAVIVAFNAGNLKPVADALRIVFPTMPMVIAADWDTPTDGDGGTGYKAACAAAIAIDAEVWSPEPIPVRNKTDFNDSHLWQQQQRRAA